MVYIIIIILCLFVLLKKQTGFNKYFGVFLLGVLITVGAFRGIKVGTDTSWYYNNWFFTTFDVKSWNHFTPFEPGFNILIAFLKNVNSSYYFFYGLIFTVTLLMFLKAAKIAKVNIGYLFSFFFLCYYFAFCMNIMRQMFALSIGAILLYSFYKKKISLIFFEIGVILITLLFHHSMIILALFPIFVFVDFNRFLNTKKLIIILVIVQILSKTALPLIQSVILNFSGIFNDRANYYIDLLDEYGFGEANSWIVAFVSCLVFILLAADKRNPIFYFSFGGLLLGILLANFGDMSRITVNASFFSIFYLADKWAKWSNGPKILLFKMLYLTCVIYILYFSLINNSAFNPYSTMFSDL